MSRAIESVILQDVRGINFEVIVVDDGSIDGTLAEVNKAASNASAIKWIVTSQANSGVAKARNRALEKASGEYIAFLDSDDVWAPEKTRLQMNILNENPDICFIGSARNGQVLRLFWRKIRRPHLIRLFEQLIKIYPQTSTVMIRREVYYNLGGYDEDFTHFEDGDFWLRILSSYQGVYLPETLVYTGMGKHDFGESGLSANLPAMHAGERLALSKAVADGRLSKPLGMLVGAFWQIKYMVRMLRVRLRGSNF